MKKIFLFTVFVMLILSLTGCSNVLHGTDELIEKAREEIPVAEAETIHIEYAGMCANKDNALIWFISGNEYQAHYYLPMECKIVGKDAYTFVHDHKPVKRGTDIVALLWGNGYSFLVNNPKCKTIRITDYRGTHDIPIEKDSYPFIYYHSLLPSEYLFLDSEGNQVY